MGDVIEVSADGVFDIPVTPATNTLQQKTENVRLASKKVAENNIEIASTAPSVPSSTTAPATVRSPEVREEEEGESGQGKPVIGAVSDSNTNLRHEYWMHKIDMPNKDVILEVVVHLSGESLHHTNIAKDGNAPKPNADHAATTTPTAPAFGEDTTRPSVSVSSTGRALTIVKGGNTVGGKGGGGRLDLILPQPIVPGSTKSFFWDGDLTIRAVLAAE